MVSGATKAEIQQNAAVVRLHAFQARDGSQPHGLDKERRITEASVGLKRGKGGGGSSLG